MTFIKKHVYDVAFICTAILMISFLAWDWNNFKSFVSGGVIATWLVLRAKR